MAQPSSEHRTSLIDLLSNTIVSRHTAPHLSVSALYSLAATSHSFRNLIFSSPEWFRYLDLSSVRAATVDAAPIDVGGLNWRHERMDEALTEDEFYSGPLRGIFSKLSRRHILEDVQTLVLDGLSVPADLVRDIMCEDRFSVRILSVREAKHLNERKLMQVLKYAVRPARPEGTPRLKGLYVFGPREAPPVQPQLPAKSTIQGTSVPRARPHPARASLISQGWNQRSQAALNATLTTGNDEKWYQASGVMFRQGRNRSFYPGSDWAETLKACEGIIFFDAVLCNGPRHDPEIALSQGNTLVGLQVPKPYLPPAIANVALGPSGCNSCSSSVEGPAIFGESSSSRFPLLSPPSYHASTVRACQLPSGFDPTRSSRLILRCEHCLQGRWCERCNKWWCESCYTGGTRTELQQQEQMEAMMSLMEVREQQNDIKVHGLFCTEHWEEMWREASASGSSTVSR